MLSVARRGYTGILRQLKLLTVDGFRVQVENGLGKKNFLNFLPVSIQKDIPIIRFPVGSLFGTLIFKGKCTTVVVFGNLLSIAVHSFCKLHMLGDIYYFSEICPGLTLIRCTRISISVTKCPLALLANFNITFVSEYSQFMSQSVPQMLLFK